MDKEYVIIVKNKTRLELLIERFNTKSQAKFYIESLGGDFEDYVLEHEIFHSSLHQLQIHLSKIIKHKIIEREYLPSYLFSEKNIIIVIGQDGLVANTAKYSKGIPIIAVNPDLDRYDGVLLPFTVKDFIAGVESAITNKCKMKTVHFAEARLNKRQRMLAFNDLFIGASTHVSARYKVTYNGKEEMQSSSGIIVSTQAGSTGWLSSVFNMAYGIADKFEKSILLPKISLKEEQLLFTVREPFKSKYTQTDIVMGLVSKQDQIIIESLMPSNGVIFSDGIESDFLQFNSGTIVSIGIAEETANLVENQNL